MAKATFIDFYGTLVYEDGEKISEITQRIYNTGWAESKNEIAGSWWNQFKNKCDNAKGEKFRTQREIEYISLSETIEKYGSTENAEELSGILFDYWRKPPIFPATKEFFEKCTIPIYIVSNIDTDDVNAALEYWDLHPNGVFTSEDAKSYKPNKEIFELALKETGLSTNEVIHIGDSISSDIEGARNVGIKSVWINRENRKCPEGVEEIHSLMEILEKQNVCMKEVE